jgi:hypothetical protein
MFEWQPDYERSGGRHPYDPDDGPIVYKLAQEKSNFTHGVWNDIGALSKWPWGNLCLHRSALGGDDVEIADLLEAIAKIAEKVLQSPMGRIRYLLGLPLTEDTQRLVSTSIAGSFLARGYFFLPLLAMPYLPHVLRVLSGDMNDDNADAKLAAGVACNLELVRRIRKSAGNKYDIERMIDIFNVLALGCEARNPIIVRLPPGSTTHAMEARNYARCRD